MIVALVLLSALLHALWNALLRLERDKDRSLVVAISVATVFAAGVAAVRGLRGEVLFASARGVGFAIAAGLFEAMYFATLARAMERGKLGLVYTVSRGGAVLVVWPASIALYGEVPTAAAIAGSIVVLGGLAMSGLGARGPARSANAGAAIGWAIACAVAIAGYHLAYKAALREAVNPSACFALSLAVSAVMGWLRLRERRAVGPLIRQRGWRLVAMGLVCSGSFLILMEALARGGSGYVLTLRNTSVLFAVAMAAMIGERPARIELGGAVLVAAGATLMAL